MSGWHSSSRPTSVLLSGAVSWVAMSACPRPSLIGAPIEQRFWNLWALLIAFASSSIDRKERRGKQKPKSRPDWHCCACCGPLFDYKLAHVSFQTLFWSMDHLVKVSVKNWYTFLLQKTSGSISGSIAYCERCGPSHVYYILFVEAGEVG